MARVDRATEALQFLKQIPLFSGLDEEAMARLARECRFHNVNKGGFIFLQADPSERAFVVRSGNVSIVLNSPNGRDMVINEMRRGDIFGELGLLTRRPRSTSAVARAESELLVIPGDGFLRMLDSEPRLARRVLEITAERLMRSGEREGALAFMDAQARLAHLLLELDRQEADTGYITISQDELAQRTGLIRQTVAKVLGNWRRNGYLLTGRGRIVLLHHHALRKLENEMII